jgi:AcrR family transcriptional regulator
VASDIDWWRGRDLQAEKLSSAVLDLISVSSIQRTTTTRISQRLQCSRAALYKRHGHLTRIFEETCTQVLASLDRQSRLPWLGGSRRAQFELLWDRFADFLCGPTGCAFLRLRAFLSSSRPFSTPLHQEQHGLPSLVLWIGETQDQAEARTRALWALCLGAAEVTRESSQHFEWRELAWSIVASPDSLGTSNAFDLEVDAAPAICVGPLLPSPADARH